MENSEVLEHTVKEASTALLHFTACRYLAVIGYVVLIYDHITTFSDEVELIWMKPINSISILFLINRYLGPIVIAIDLFDKGGISGHLTTGFCVGWLWLETYMQIILHAMIHAMVALRVRALWGLKPTVDWILGASFMLYFSATVIIAGVANAPISDKLYFHELFRMCFVDQITPWFYWVWVPPLMLEVLLFALTIARAIRYSKRNTLMPVTRVLYRDGFVYFLVIATCTIFNIVAWAALPPTLVTLAKYFGFAIVNTMGSKLVLNLRGIRKEDDVMAEPSHHSLPKFELSQLPSSDPQRTKHPLTPLSRSDAENNKERSVRFDSQGKRAGHTLTKSPSTGRRNDQVGVASFNSVQVQVDVHVDVDTDGDSSWEVRGEDDKQGDMSDGKVQVRW